MQTPRPSIAQGCEIKPLWWSEGTAYVLTPQIFGWTPDGSALVMGNEPIGWSRAEASA